MIKDIHFWEVWKAQAVASERPDFQRNLAILEAMYDHARLMGAFQTLDLLDGLEFKIHMAKVLNAPRAS